MCTGSGGVGKTTTAAVIALEAARPGRRRAWSPSTRPSGWPTPRARRAHRTRRAAGRGRLARRAVGADARHQEHVRRPRRQERRVRPSRPRTSSTNRFYRNISGALSGTQEYMAMEKLYELHEDGDFDLIVVDTPPTRNALDFLEAPRRLTRFLDHRLYRVLMAPTRGIVKAVNVAAQAFLRTVSKVVGGDVVRDAIAFFRPSTAWSRGSATGPTRVLELLSRRVDRVRAGRRAPRATSSRRPRTSPSKLAEADIPVRALIVNRMHPRFSDASPDAMTRAGQDLRRHRPRRALRQPGRLPHRGVAARRRTWPAWPSRWPRPRWCGCRSSTPTCTTSTAWPRSAPTCSRATGRPEPSAGVGRAGSAARRPRRRASR